ncbi:MAG: adenylyltransferase/cytidyltransferase family protein, partial [Planctomycetota bacterium]
MEEKILFLEDLAQKVEDIQKEGKVVVQSHGIFDLLHPGIIAHLDSAREQGDFLVATVIRDEDVRRGPGRPIFNEQLRAKNVASLSQVDYVCIVSDQAPYESVKRIKPDVLAYGQTYKERDREIHEKLFEEERELYFGKSRIYETGGLPVSSSGIIKDIFEMYPDETRNFIGKFKERHGFDEIREGLKGLQAMKVLLIGDGIIDEYHYCAEMNKSAKSPIVVNRYLEHEV